MSSTSRWRVDVIGRSRLLVDETEVALTAAEARLLAGLALAGARGAAEERLLSLMWPDGTRPPTARQSLHNHVSRVRRKAGGPLIRRSRQGYRLDPAVTVDLQELDALVALVGHSHRSGEWGKAVEHTDAVSAALSGTPPTVDLPDDPVAASRAAGIAEDVLRVEELGADAMMMAGRIDDAAALLQRLSREAPTREVRWELLLAALRTAGRPAEALEVYHVARRALLRDHGTEPGARLKKLHESLLEPTTPRAGPWTTDRPVGRDEDIDRISDRLRDDCSVIVTGDAGIGKSTVLAAIASRWPGPVLALECQENPWTALAPVETLLELLTARLHGLGLPTDLAALRSVVPTEPLDRPRRAGSLTIRAIEAIAAALRQTPTPLLLIDDIDRSGPTTRSILLTAAAQAAVPTVLSARVPLVQPLLPLDPAEIRLEGLRADALTEMARQHVDLDEDEARATGRWLSSQTDGHPLFATELLRAQAHRRPWADDPDERHARVSGLPPPRSLTASIRRRIGLLSPPSRIALDAAAVLGDPIDVILLRRVVDVGQLDSLVEAGILRRAHGQYRFAHGLLRQVAHDLVPSGRRSELHHTFGLMTEDPVRRAHHLSQGLALDPHAAMWAMTAAGRSLSEGQAYEDAARWFAAAVEQAPAVGLSRAQVLTLRLDACDAARMAGRTGHAEPLLDLAEEALDQPHLDLRRRAVITAAQLGEAVDPGPLQRRAAALVDRAVAAEEDRTWQARLQATGSILHSMTGEPDRCREMFLSALADLCPDDDALTCDVLPYAYMALGRPEDLPQREQLAARLHAAALRRGDHAAQWEAGHLRWSAAVMRGDGQLARQAAEECTRLLTFVGDAGRRWSVGYMRADIAAIDGRDDDAERISAETLEIGQGVAPGRAMSVLSSQLLVLRWRQGRLDELADTIRYLIAAQPEIAAWRGAGSLILAAVDPTAAGELFDGVAVDGFSRIPRDVAWLAGMVVLGGAAVRLQDRRRAAIVLPVLEEHEDLVCWQGSCSFGPVSRVAADLASLMGLQDRAAALRSRAVRLDRSLARGQVGQPIRT